MDTMDTMGKKGRVTPWMFFFRPDAALQDLGVTFYVLSMGSKLGSFFRRTMTSPAQNKRILCCSVV